MPLRVGATGPSLPPGCVLADAALAAVVLAAVVLAEVVLAEVVLATGPTPWHSPMLQRTIGSPMALSPPAPRELLHNRDIALRGWRRADGLYDIEAHLLDTKTYPFENDDRGEIAPGTPLHGMWLRLTVDEALLVVACEAFSEHTPYAICPQAAPNFARLAGLTIGPGFNRSVAERVGGVLGCTHLRELLGQMATVAYQTLYPIRAAREREAAARRLAAGEAAVLRKPAMVGTCMAYAPDSPVTLARWPWLKDQAAD